jgi:hypothetical protein
MSVHYESLCSVDTRSFERAGQWLKNPACLHSRESVSRGILDSSRKSRDPWALVPEREGRWALRAAATGGPRVVADRGIAASVAELVWYCPLYALACRPATRRISEVNGDVAEKRVKTQDLRGWRRR